MALTSFSPIARFQQPMSPVSVAPVNFRQNAGNEEMDELKPLEEYGIKSIDLQEDKSKEIIAGNRVEGYSAYHTEHDSGKVGEVYFNYFA